MALGSNLDASVVAAMVEDRGKILISGNPGTPKDINVVRLRPKLIRND